MPQRCAPPQRYLEDMGDALGLDKFVWHLFLCDHHHAVLATDGDAGDASSLDGFERIFCTEMICDARVGTNGLVKTYQLGTDGLLARRW